MRWNKNSLCRAALYLLGLLAGIVFFASKSEVLLNRIIASGGNYGDLYRLAKIKRFKPAHPLPDGPRANPDSLDENDLHPEAAPVIFFGDSFGFCDWGGDTFHAQLAAAAGQKIYTVFNNNHPDISARPPQFLKSLAADPMPRRIFVYERVERYLPEIFGKKFPHMMDLAHKANTSALKRLYNAWFENTEARNELLIKNNLLSDPILEAWNSEVFEWLRQMPAGTPWYSTNPPMLFYKDDVNSFTAQHPNDFINLLADNIASFDRLLREQYNCTLVFAPVPDKISLYHGLATTHPVYDDFLPRLCAATKKRGVRTVELLPAFQAETNLLYWPTDTHWNNMGIQIAVAQTMKVWPQR